MSTKNKKVVKTTFSENSTNSTNSTGSVEPKKISPAEIAYNLGYWLSIAQEFYQHVNKSISDGKNR